MNWLEDARQALHDALKVAVFDVNAASRVQPYPPGERVAAPAVWIGDHLGNIADGAGVATFSVVGVVDGEIEAQYALRDAMLAATISACHRTTGLRPVRWRCQQITLETSTPLTPVSLRGFILEVNVTAATRTFCPPVQAPATIPTSDYVEV